MDASASTEVNNSRFNEVCGLYFNVDNIILPTSLNRDKKVVKYTKLPEFDFDSKASWSRHSYTLPPRLRRIIALDDQDILLTSRSLQHEQKLPQRFMSGTSKRKIITINEDDENEIRSVYPKQIMSVRKETQANRAVTAALSPAKTSSRVTSPKFSRSSRSIKTASLSSTKNLSSKVVPKDSNASKTQSLQNYNSKVHIIKHKETTISSHNLNSVSKITDKKNKFAPKEKVSCNIMRNKLAEQPNVGKTTLKTPVLTPKFLKPTASSKLEASLFKEIKAQNRHHDVVKEIHVPVVEKYESKNVVETMMTHIIVQPIEKESMMNLKVDKYTEIDEKANVDMNVGTDSPYELVDKSTEMEKSDLKLKFVDAVLETPVNNFDSLNIPNVTLIKDRSDDIPKEDAVTNDSQSLPNLDVPATNLQVSKGVIPASSEEDSEKQITNSTSYIIGRATLTYTTKQKINFHVVGNKSHSATDVYSSPLSYPMNVVSVYKKEIKKRDLKDVIEADKNSQNKKDQLKIENINPWKEIKSLDCSKLFDTSKLVKPSEVITTIGVNGDFLQNDYICEQFQRELNFIDSFFESLQYLESCSLSDKCFDDDRVEKWVSKSGFDVTNQKYDSLFSKFDSDANNEDTETIASKSLCLLNLLIRDERRRAKNLLFVLKMREDALKDFTKSQILWLENKKKQENTDISTLKKKQRGALLKLQHECGEMQRMRKALLALSEKRKLALMKTKKNIELKLNNNVNVNQIVLGKKKIKRNTADRNVAPLKCFDLSSSGCDEGVLHHLSRPRSDSALLAESIVSRVEKSIQTGDGVPATPATLATLATKAPQPALVDQATNTAVEHYVVVDGGYLNILFQNLSLPLIFSAGKQYEVNEEALKNIVNSTNSHSSNLNDSDLVGKFMDQIKSRDLDKSSSPSTARSLVEEFDQYYTGLVEAENSQTDSEGTEFKTVTDPVPKYLVDNKSVSSPENFRTPFFSSITSSTVTVPHEGECISNVPNEGGSVDLCLPVDDYMGDVEKQSEEVKADGVDDSVVEAGLLPVPAGSPAAARADAAPPDVPAAPHKKSSTSMLSAGAEDSASSPSSCPSVSSVTYSPPAPPAPPAPPLSEAEELRRQQLAIEREIKALEQQQILVVREIPDKPPPPYTPPIESRSQKSLRIFTVDETIEQKIARYIANPDKGPDDPRDPMDVYINDFCLEKIDKHKSEESDKPWVACNLLPQKTQLDIDKLVEKATAEMKEILAGVHPTAVTGVGARRADHIDDILFAEWRRREPAWTALHTDEASVKNQIFESIFQKILSESVDEYKKNVLNANLSASDGQSGV